MTTQDIDRLYLRIGTRMREIRRKQHITQAALATSLGYDRTSITNIEAGTQRAPLHTLLIIWEALGVDISAIQRMCTAQARGEGQGKWSELSLP